MSLGFIARGYGLAAPSARLYYGELFLHYWQTKFDTCLLGFLLLGRGCCVGVTMIASGSPNFRRFCALRLAGKIQVGIIPTCVSSEGRIMPFCTIFKQIPTSACASRHAPCEPCWIAFRIISPAASCLLIIFLFIIG